VFVALDLDATVFSENERGPQWMTSAGISVAPPTTSRWW